MHPYLAVPDHQHVPSTTSLPPSPVSHHRYYSSLLDLIEDKESRDSAHPQVPRTLSKRQIRLTGLLTIKESSRLSDAL